MMPTPDAIDLKLIDRAIINLEKSIDEMRRAYERVVCTKLDLSYATKIANAMDLIVPEIALMRSIVRGDAVAFKLLSGVHSNELLLSRAT